VPWLLLAAATIVLTVLGYYSRLPWLLPLLQVVPAYPILVRDLKEGKTSLAVLRMLAWALVIALTVGVLALHAPETGAASVLHGQAYRDEMVRWVRTGAGTESMPSRFLPQHLLHAAAFAALSLATGSLLSLVLGAVLMNYMSFYVGSLLSLARRPGIVLLCGWPPWSILRVIAFVILGVVLAGPFLRRVAGIPFRWADRRGWILAAAVGLVLDAALKAMLAPSWGRILRSALFPLSPGL
jgi:hypothetical protein